MSVVGDASPSELGLPAQHVKLVCTHNSARSQFAAALCKERSTVPVASAGTTPADGVHPRASKTSCGRALSQSPSATTPANSSAVASTTLEHAYLDRAGRVDRRVPPYASPEKTDDQFASRSTVVNFLPLLAERFARQRLRAMAKVEGHVRDGKPVVLFLCARNAGRSQMALGLFEHLGKDRAVAWSGGSGPDYQTTPSAVAPCGSAASTTPAGKDVSDVRPVRDEIERRVRGLLQELDVEVRA